MRMSRFKKSDSHSMECQVAIKTNETNSRISDLQTQLRCVKRESKMQNNVWSVPPFVFKSCITHIQYTLKTYLTN